MCNAVEEYAKEYAKEENAKLLIKMSEEFGLTKEGILEKLQENLNISLSKAEEYWREYYAPSEI